MFDGEALKTLLDSKNIRQAHLARMAGVPRDLISRYVSGTVQPKADKITAIADALGVTMETLIKTEAKIAAPKLKLCFCPNCGVSLEGVIRGGNL